MHLQAMRNGVGMLGLLLAMQAGAQDTNAVPPTPTPAPAACRGDEYRQFDFWVGAWDVRDSRQNQLQGTSRIERGDNGCWIVEHWHSAQGNDGTSLNAWDAQYKVWRQFWTGADGVVLRLQGGLQDGAMVMDGELPNAKGGVQLQRIRWTPAADGSVTQRWETSDDAGKSWQVAFEGVYRHPQADTSQ